MRMANMKKIDSTWCWQKSEATRTLTLRAEVQFVITPLENCLAESAEAQHINTRNSIAKYTPVRQIQSLHQNTWPSAVEWINCDVSTQWNIAYLDINDPHKHSAERKSEVQRNFMTTSM